MSSLQDVEKKGLLFLDRDDSDDEEPIKISRDHRKARLLQSLLILLSLVLGFALGRFSAPKHMEMEGLAPYCKQSLPPALLLSHVAVELIAHFLAPATNLVEYLHKRFDQGYGENMTDGRRVYYAGPATDEIDANWAELEFGESNESLSPSLLRAAGSLTLLG
jgi:hypothetical protein